jgi:hypothetical protein
MDGLECKILLKWMMRRYHFRTHPYMHTPPVLWCLQLMGKRPFFHLRHQGGEDPALTNHGHLRTDVCFFSIELMPCLQNRPQKSKAAGMKIYLSADIHSKFGPLWCSVGLNCRKITQVPVGAIPDEYQGCWWNVCSTNVSKWRLRLDAPGTGWKPGMFRYVRLTITSWGFWILMKVQTQWTHQVPIVPC